MKPDPPFTGRCAVCNKKLPKLKVHGVYEFDPFCSVTHAREWHGVPLTVTPTEGHASRSRAGKPRDPMLEAILEGARA